VPTPAAALTSDAVAFPLCRLPRPSADGAQPHLRAAGGGARPGPLRGDGGAPCCAARPRSSAAAARLRRHDTHADVSTAGEQDAHGGSDASDARSQARPSPGSGMPLTHALLTHARHRLLLLSAHALWPLPAAAGAPAAPG
jgi:hypothetical protein